MNRIWKNIALATAVLLIGIGAFSAYPESQSNTTTVTVYKDASCGCCTKWVDHLKENGFQVTAHDTTDLMKVKTEHGVPGKLSSCHTALVDRYVVEGHVPADVVKRLLSEKPDVVGIAVPGMPMGSPGMEGNYSEPYNVLTFDRQGNTKVYTSH